MASTEKWIQSILNIDTKKNGSSSNPYSRKEVSYECDVEKDVADVLSSIFQRLRTMREMGDEYGLEAEGREKEQKKGPPLHQTVVSVIPLLAEFQDFLFFDGLVQKINEARRDARDHVTDQQKKEEDAWITSINMSHLHPTFGEGQEEDDERLYPIDFVTKCPWSELDY